MTEFSFGGHDLSGLLVCTSVERFVSPGLRLDKTEVPGMDGCHALSTGLDALEVSVGVAMRADHPADVTDARREIAQALSGGEKRLLLPDEPNRYLLATFEGGGSWSRAYNGPTATLTFLCSDPVAYGNARKATVGTGGAYVDAGGTYRARPVVTCKPASGSYWTLTNATTGAFVRVEANFTGSQTVVLDMARERCTVNGADHAVTLSSDFFAMEGVQQLKVSSGTATVEWEERWL